MFMKDLRVAWLSQAAGVLAVMQVPLLSVSIKMVLEHIPPLASAMAWLRISG